MNGVKDLYKNLEDEMGKYITYELKIEPKYYKEVYRIIKIDGNNTLDYLSDKILSAFDFDMDHLYMFSLSRNRYDSEGYYHPEVTGRKNAAKVSLNELNLKDRNKFLFVYDFGDEWLFDITVKKIEQSDILSLTHVKEQSGRIEQYPAWDEEEWEDEYEDFLDNNVSEHRINILDSNFSMIELLSKNNPSELKTIMKKLGIKVPKVSKGASKAYATDIVKYLYNNKERLLELMTPNAANLLLCIAAKDNEAIMMEIMKTLCLDILINLGLLDINEEQEVHSIELTKELYMFADFFSEPKRMDTIKQSNEWQKVIIALINLYGVVDLNFLHHELCDYFNTKMDLKNLEKTVIEPLVFWGEMDVLEDESIKIATLFNESQTKYILLDRNNFDVYNYKKFDYKEISNVISEGIASLVPSSNDLMRYLILDKGLDPNIVAMFMAELSISCLISEDRDIILQRFKEKLSDNSLKLTKKVKSIILEFIEQHPCSILMGYSWDEYNNRNEITTNNQLNLFDDIPF